MWYTIVRSHIHECIHARWYIYVHICNMAAVNHQQLAIYIHKRLTYMVNMCYLLSYIATVLYLASSERY